MKYVKNEKQFYLKMFRRIIKISNNNTENYNVTVHFIIHQTRSVFWDQMISDCLYGV